VARFILELTSHVPLDFFLIHELVILAIICKVSSMCLVKTISKPVNVSLKKKRRKCSDTMCWIRLHYDLNNLFKCLEAKLSCLR